MSHSAYGYLLGVRNKIQQVPYASFSSLGDKKGDDRENPSSDRAWLDLLPVFALDGNVHASSIAQNVVTRTGLARFFQIKGLIVMLNRKMTHGYQIDILAFLKKETQVHSWHPCGSFQLTNYSRYGTLTPISSSFLSQICCHSPANSLDWKGYRRRCDNVFSVADHIYTKTKPFPNEQKCRWVLAQKIFSAENYPL